jgi:phage tail sheath gpL-like
MAIQKPAVTVTLRGTNATISTGPQKVLFVGQMTSGAVATDTVLVENIGNANEWDALFGHTSMLASMIRAFRKINPVTHIDAIPLADLSGGTAATGSIAFTGTSTAAGTLYATVGGYNDNRYQLDITSGMTATAAGAALAALVNADYEGWTTAVNTTGSVALTAIHKGTEGNTINLIVEGNVPGLTVTVTAMASGAGNPVITSIFNQVADARYQTIVFPSTYAVGPTLLNFLDPRFNVVNDVLDGRLVQCIADSKANLISTGTANNSQNYVIIGLKAVADTAFKGNGSRLLPCSIASQVAAIRSLRLTEGANIVDYVTTSAGSLDTIGGAALASFPYFNTPLPFVPVFPVGKDWSKDDVEDLAAAGISCIGNNRAKNLVVVGDLVTTYKTDSFGNADVTFKYLNNVDVASTVRELFDSNLRQEFAQCRLTLGDLRPGRSMANAKSIAAFCDQIFSLLGNSDFVLVQGGPEVIAYFKANRTVSINMPAGSVTIIMLVPIVTQLRAIIVPMQITFSIN